ncbi:hypothetical protein [Aquibacillus kalidii]|uniref:hypothetical protein n=1 Tax=Aquibacillus kalidii TaxID=2762597 RepID=UPI001646C50E|nr:hypothetical protein [Aquibacillus kalidii]
MELEELEYLLTYNASNYEWFASEEELVSFIKEHDITSYEAWHIPEAFEIEIELD